MLGGGTSILEETRAYMPTEIVQVCPVSVNVRGCSTKRQRGSTYAAASKIRQNTELFPSQMMAYGCAPGLLLLLEFMFLKYTGILNN